MTIDNYIKTFYFSLLGIFMITNTSKINFYDSDCVFYNGENTFIENIETYDFIAQVEPLGLEQHPADVFMREGKFYKFIIIDSIKGGQVGDTLSIVSCGGLDCWGCFNTKETTLLKSNFTLRQDLEFKFGLDSQSTHSILYMAGGNVAQLVVRDNQVIGNFTKNKAARRNKITRWLRKLSFVLIQRQYISESKEMNQQHLYYQDVKKEIISKISS